MDSRAALGAAAAVALTVTGSVSALFLTIAQPGHEADQSVTADSAVTVEYVDQYGNPVADPTAANAANAGSPEIVLINPDGTPATATVAPSQELPADYQANGEYAESDEEDEEYEEHEEHEEHEEDEERQDYEEHEEGEHEDYEEAGAEHQVYNHD